MISELATSCSMNNHDDKTFLDLWDYQAAVASLVSLNYPDFLNGLYTYMTSV